MCVCIIFIDSAVVDSGSVSNVTSESVPSTPTSMLSESVSKSLFSPSSCSTPAIFTENSSVYSIHSKWNMCNVYSICYI